MKAQYASNSFEHLVNLFVDTFLTLGDGKEGFSALVALAECAER